MDMMKLVVVGAAGRMGQSLIRAIDTGNGIALYGAVERPGADALGHDAGEIAGIGSNGVIITEHLILPYLQQPSILPG